MKVRNMLTNEVSESPEGYSVSKAQNHFSRLWRVKPFQVVILPDNGEEKPLEKVYSLRVKDGRKWKIDSVGISKEEADKRELELYSLGLKQKQVEVREEL